MLTTDEQQLLSDVESYLHITWQDDNTDKNVTGYIRRGKARLQDIAGVSSLDFTIEDLPRQLLFDYCRYANSQALEMFENNFQSDLLELSLRYQFDTPFNLKVVSTAGQSIGYTHIGVSPQLEDGNSYMYKLGTSLTLPGFFDVCDSVCGYTIWNEIDEIQANSGDDVLIVEIDKSFKAIRAGKSTVVVN